MQTRRRSLQLAGAALAGLAGCLSTLGGGGGADAPGEDTDAPGDGTPSTATTTEPRGDD